MWRVYKGERFSIVLLNAFKDDSLDVPTYRCKLEQAGRLQTVPLIYLQVQTHTNGI